MRSFLKINFSEEILNPAVPMALRLSGILMGSNSFILSLSLYFFFSRPSKSNV